MQETPFSLTYRSETIIPVEILIPNPRMTAYAAEANEEERRMNIDLIEKKKDVAATRIVLYPNILASYYNVGVKHLPFNP